MRNENNLHSVIKNRLEIAGLGGLDIDKLSICTTVYQLPYYRGTFFLLSSLHSTNISQLPDAHTERVIWELSVAKNTDHQTYLGSSGIIPVAFS